MITRATSRGICRSCRNDLVFFVSSRRCSILTFSSIRSIRRRQYSALQRTKNILYTPHRFRSTDSTTDDASPQEHQESSPTLEDIVAAQGLIEAIEKELGKPIKQAIIEDTEYVQAKSSENSSETLTPPTTPHDFVAILRSQGVSPAEIARGARQLCGDSLPNGLLNEEEFVSYRRLYGEPAKEPEDDEDYDEIASTEQNQLFTAEGEAIHVQPDVAKANADEEQDATALSSPEATSLTDARITDVAQSVHGTLVEEDDYEELEEDEDEEASGLDRDHPLTRLGKFKTSPRTVFLSQEGFVKPVEKIMSNYANKHLKQVCEKTFGGPGLPNSPVSPKAGYLRTSGWIRQQVPIPLPVTQNTMGEMEANAFVSAVMPPTYAAIQSVLVETRKRLGPTWLNGLLGREGGPRILDAGSGGVGIIVWREIVQAHWDSLHGSSANATSPPPSKAVVLTASDGLRHRAAEMLDNTTFIPRLPDYIHTRGSPTLEDDRPTQQRKQFDVIIAPHQLFNLQEDWMRKQYIQNLWTMLSNHGGILILIEKGIPRGFEALATAREMLLDRYIAVPEGQTTRYSGSDNQQLDDDGIHRKETAMIVAPCTNHERCPMYPVPGLSKGRKDICSFQQRYIRPAFLQRILGAKDHNHDDVNFSYLSVMKGKDLRSRDFRTWDHVHDPLSAPIHSSPAALAQDHRDLISELEDGFEHIMPQVSVDEGDDSIKETISHQLPTFQHMPRIIYPPIKRRGHVTMDLCTPRGEIARWTIPKSFSKQGYRDARKSKWGDIWALGAKTCRPSNLHLGTPEKNLVDKDGEIILGKGRGRKERLKIKAMKALEMEQEQRMEDLMEEGDMVAALDEELEAYDDGEHTAGLEDIPSEANKKPMNNRQRKQARKALREAKTESKAPMQSDAADLTFKPAGRPLRRKDLMDEIADDHAMSEWNAEFLSAAAEGKGIKAMQFKDARRSRAAAKEVRKRKSKYGDL